jgi:hypothetical protein
VQKKNWELANPSSIERPQHIRSEFHVENPKYTSINQKIDEKIKVGRLREGLAEDTSDVKETHEKVPSINYINSPTVATKRLLEQSRKEDMLQQLNQYESKVGHMPDAKARLEEREGAFLRKTYKADENAGRTKGKIDAARKEADVDNLTKKYGTVIIGIHGQELPKFEE